ncbi:hypothetical protein [Cupriavidus basilensis]|uniref:Uncharacterized protein n=1 Tax=Cupriavidus basilensis TaxID=68895 RepID=A0A7M2H403_9BURK|nr:hypothetical protein [Cupriavidus basilensis]QOT79643.1 hypothetical protein F7R26_033685 [Cupriavidus basilensis]
MLITIGCTEAVTLALTAVAKRGETLARDELGGKPACCSTRRWSKASALRLAMFFLRAKDSVIAFA